MCYNFLKHNPLDFSSRYFCATRCNIFAIVFFSGTTCTLARCRCYKVHRRSYRRYYVDILFNESSFVAEIYMDISRGSQMLR